MRGWRLLVPIGLLGCGGSNAEQTFPDAFRTSPSFRRAAQERVPLGTTVDVAQATLGRAGFRCERYEVPANPSRVALAGVSCQRHHSDATWSVILLHSAGRVDSLWGGYGRRAIDEVHAAP